MFALCVGAGSCLITLLVNFLETSVPFVNGIWFVLVLPAYMIAMQFFFLEEDMKVFVLTLIFMQWFLIGYVISLFRFKKH